MKYFSQVLSDETKRQQYDTYGTTTEQMGREGAGPFSSSQGFGGGSQQWEYRSSVDPQELFRKIFGEHGFMGQTDFDDSPFGMGSAQEVVLNVTFAQAARGVNKDISINVVDTCTKCRGSCAEPGSKQVKCIQCNGTGMETVHTGKF